MTTTRSSFLSASKVRGTFGSVANTLVNLITSRLAEGDTQRCREKYDSFGGKFPTAAR